MKKYSQEQEDKTRIRKQNYKKLSHVPKEKKSKTELYIIIS